MFSKNIEVVYFILVAKTISIYLYYLLVPTSNHIFIYVKYKCTLNKKKKEKLVMITNRKSLTSILFLKHMLAILSTEFLQTC